MVYKEEENTPLLVSEKGSEFSVETQINSFELDGNLTKMKKKENHNHNHNHNIDEEKGAVLNGHGNGTTSSSEYDPFKNRCVDNPTSNMDTMTHILKSNIGTGILAMPQAILNGGLIVGTFGSIIVAAICVYSMNMLVNCTKTLSKRTKTPSLSFSQVAVRAFDDGPPICQKLSRHVGILINVFLTIAQLGFCSVYFVFIARNMKIVLHSWFNIDLSTKLYMVILLLPMILLCWIRSLRLLAKFEMLANIVMGVGIGIIVYYCVLDIPPVTPERLAYFTTWKQLPLWFGTTIFAFEGIGVVLPLENKMKRPQDFGGCCGILTLSMLIVGFLYIGVGVLGYVQYGPDTQASITLNLPAGEPLAETVRLVMAISIFFTYAIAFYVPIDVIMPKVKKCTQENRWTMYELMIRSFLVLLTLGIAEAIPNLGPLISLVGAVCSTTLAFIFPPIIDMATNYANGYGKYRWILWKDMVMVLFGLTGFLTGTYISIEEIINTS